MLWQDKHIQSEYAAVKSAISVGASVGIDVGVFFVEPGKFVACVMYSRGYKAIKQAGYPIVWVYSHDLRAVVPEHQYDQIEDGFLVAEPICHTLPHVQ